MTARDERVSAASEAIRDWLSGRRPRVAVVLGSGLGGLADAVEDGTSLAYSDVPGFPAATVAGHSGELIAGTLDGGEVLLQRGRFHLYEGHDADTVALPVRSFSRLGIRVLWVTNAAGGLRRTMQPPLLMLIADHINLMWRNPLLGPVLQREERFPDMSSPYDSQLRTIARTVAQEQGITMDEGVYAGVLGPSYETPAEIQMLQRFGADAVGMSTVPEVVAARASGMRVLGVSSITNFGAGMTADTLSHADVLEAGQSVAQDLERLIRGVLRGGKMAR